MRANRHRFFVPEVVQSSAMDCGPCQAYASDEEQFIADLAGQVHKDYAEGLKFARVWGSAVRRGAWNRLILCLPIFAGRSLKLQVNY